METLATFKREVLDHSLGGTPCVGEEYKKKNKGKDNEASMLPTIQASSYLASLLGENSSCVIQNFVHPRFDVLPTTRKHLLSSLTIQNSCKF
mmetsp:Transcript_19981/g.49117  ORF Transcript_19981/g.49117 Transcript_19981/m.49117 type:complete len:92 (-) Transcript_19981:660-935(-)